MDIVYPEGLQPITTDIISLFEAPLGRFVMATAQLDMELNFLIYETHPLIADKKLAKKPPRMLGDKLELLTRVFEQHPTLAPIAPDALALLLESSQLNELRSFVVHGALSGYIPGDFPALYFLKADYSNTHKSYQGKAMLVGFRELVAGGHSITLATRGLDNIVKLLRSARRPVQ